ncbi:MAG: hypothetical protein BWY98_00510 [Tenericutes bacterium ADurb.BinA155]|nr:MAG: hypothetical protein BWY98_00510 [Tenericutes bacterium ADurb.BinA155]
MLVVTALIFGMLAIYGIFSFSYGFASSSGPSSGYELLTVTQIKIWQNIGSKDNYSFVAITNTGKAYLGSGTLDDISTLTGVLYVTNKSSYSQISIAWWFVFPILSLIVLCIPGPRHHVTITQTGEQEGPNLSRVSDMTAVAAPAPKEPTPAPVPPKPLTPEEKEAIAHRHRKTGLILGIISSTVVTGIVITVAVTNSIANKNKEIAVNSNSLSPAGRTPFILGSMTSPLTSASSISSSLSSHEVVDVYYSFSNPYDSTISIPNTVKDLVIYNASSRYAYFSFSVPSGRTTALTLGLSSIRASDLLFQSNASFDLNLKFSGSNDVSYPNATETGSSSYYVFDAPKVNLSLIAAGDKSSFTMETKDGASGKSGTNGQTSTVVENDCNGTDGTPGYSSVNGFRVKTLKLLDSSADSVFSVSTGDGGRGGNGGKHGWFMGVFGLWSHNGRDGTPGAGGTAGRPIYVANGSVTYNGRSGSVSSTGNYSSGCFKFIRGENGANGVVNS